MGVSYLSISAVCTLISFVGLQCWTGLSIQKLTSEELVGEAYIKNENAHHALQLLLGSRIKIALLANFALNVFILLLLGIKTVFFGELYPPESQKLVERLVNYLIYKGIFLPLVVPPTIVEAGLWSTWLTILCSLKIFQALARDRLERLNASPSTSPWTYFRIYSVLLLVVSCDLVWIKLWLVMYKTRESPMFLLSFYEPLNIAFETLQAIVVHGFQLLDIWLHHSTGNNTNCQRFKLFDISAAGSLWEWKCTLIRYLVFFFDVMTLSMALGHYVHIWWLHGMTFHLVDAILFLNIRALLIAFVKRVKGFIRLRIALTALHGALPDASSEEIQAYDDECAICREPMAKAKRLACNHLFHLSCLRSWLDQGSNENYSCPVCRKPLNLGRPEGEANSHAVNVSTDEHLARQFSGLDRHNPPDHALPTGMFTNQMQNPLEIDAWRGSGLESSWLNSWSGQATDEAGPSTGAGTVGIGRVQMMMRHLAAVGETYAQTALEDAAWSLWPMNPPQAGASSSSIPPGSVRYLGSAGGLRVRTTSRTAQNDIANILSMAETVREVLPHIPDELIFQDLQQTNSVTVTVNNLLQM